jgi:hypothetical protein
MDEQNLAELEMQDEAMDHIVSIEEKKALINEAKRRHGKDWSKILNFKSGMDWQSLKFKLQQ